MKELTIEENAKAYDEALEKAKKNYDIAQDLCNGSRMGVECFKNTLINIFPELKESEDEKMRKMCVRYLDRAYQHQSAAENRKNIEKCITWLEKRVKRTYAALGQSEMTNTSDQELEPKFHEGEWIISNTADKDYHICKITGIKDGNYTIESICGYKGYNQFDVFDTAYKLWTIQDAKDGDVLDANGAPFIYKKHDKDYVYFYCGVNLAGEFIEANEFDTWNNNYKVYPATKEQRDILFAKMEEAGWQWDAETHQLKKIGDEEYNGEDYGIDSLWNAKNILEKTLGKVDGYQSDDGILEHKCAISAVKKLYEQKSAWSEEDERIMKAIIQFFESQDDNTTYSLVSKKIFLLGLTSKANRNLQKTRLNQSLRLVIGL